MVYVFTKLGKGEYMSLEQFKEKPSCKEEHEVNINGVPAQAGMSDDVVYVALDEVVDIKQLLSFVKYFIRKCSQSDWWCRNSQRMDLFETSSIIATT